MPDTDCPTRRELEQKVIVAVRDQYAAKGDAKAAARKAEREAVKALEAHIEEHRCKDGL